MTYLFKYDGTNLPTWEKTFESSGGEVFSVSLVFENLEDRLQLTSEQAYEHMQNLLQYVKDRTQDLELIGLDEEPPLTFWSLRGDYDTTHKCIEEIQKWWGWAYYNDKFDTEEE